MELGFAIGKLHAQIAGANISLLGKRRSLRR
jgi:hypothetical protein